MMHGWKDLNLNTYNVRDMDYFKRQIKINPKFKDIKLRTILYFFIYTFNLNFKSLIFLILFAVSSFSLLFLSY